MRKNDRIELAVSLAWRSAGLGRWLAQDERNIPTLCGHDLKPEVLADEDAVGEAMLDEIRGLARNKLGKLVIVLLGGRGGQALHRKLGVLATAPQPVEWIRRLHLFMQDALAPLPTTSTLSFVYDFRRLLGPAFLEQVGGFHVLRTNTKDLTAEVEHYVSQMLSLGGPDIFFVGHGPEPDNASHIAYIRPKSGASAADLCGVIPISAAILEHHIAKFRAGGVPITAEDEVACRRASSIVTLGPALLLQSRRVVQSIVDADTAPAKRATYRNLRETKLAERPEVLARQLDENPGLWVRVCGSIRSLVLPNLIDSVPS
jgi:6-phosphogluconolactonase/glucosamine-6-phosphate isomerase/deaminase